MSSSFAISLRLMVKILLTPCSCISSSQSPLRFGSAFGETEARSLAPPLPTGTALLGPGGSPVTMPYSMSSSFAMSLRLMVKILLTPCSCISSSQSPLRFGSAFGETEARSLAPPLPTGTALLGPGGSPVTMPYSMSSSLAMSLRLMVRILLTPCSCISSSQSPLRFGSAFGETEARSLAPPLPTGTALLGPGGSPVTMPYSMSSSLAMSLRLMVRILLTPCSCMVMP